MARCCQGTLAASLQPENNCHKTARMKIGVFDHMQKNDRPELSYQDLYARHLDMVQFLDEAGFDYYFVAEHHFDLGFAECSSPGA